MKRLAILLVLLSCFAFGPTQEFRLVATLPVSGQASVTTDPLGNCYLTVGNQVLKFDPAGKPLSNFSQVDRGELRGVDALNPLKVQLFYPDFAQIILLNTQLSVQSTINLRSLDIQQPWLACSSLNDGYWVYDMQDAQLKKIGLDLQLQFQSGNLNQILKRRLVPVALAEYEESVFMSDPERGILVFDRFGNYDKTLPAREARKFQVVGEDLLYLRGDSVFAMNRRTAEERPVILPAHAGALRDFRFEQQQLYLLTTDALSIYSF
jgi:hypothetical protein